MGERIVGGRRLAQASLGRRRRVRLVLGQIRRSLGAAIDRARRRGARRELSGGAPASKSRSSGSSAARSGCAAATAASTRARCGRAGARSPAAARLGGAAHGRRARLGAGRIAAEAVFTGQRGAPAADGSGGVGAKAAALGFAIRTFMGNGRPRPRSRSAAGDTPEDRWLTSALVDVFEIGRAAAQGGRRHDARALARSRRGIAWVRERLKLPRRARQASERQRQSAVPALPGERRARSIRGGWPAADRHDRVGVFSVIGSCGCVAASPGPAAAAGRAESALDVGKGLRGGPQAFNASPSPASASVTEQAAAREIARISTGACIRARGREARARPRTGPALTRA